MKKVELLAPAGSMESLYAAIACGADAVYLGGNKFSARAYASNFSNEAMMEAIDYCHINGVKIYVTLNTLIKESEMPEAVDYVKYLYEAGVDGLIVQDLGLAYLLKKYFNKFEIHASTQMTIHNGEGALLLTKEGFKRIVLSRELSLDEIKHISIDMNVETEIFVHGALCICYSGQCLMSSMIGGRSGNRGRCAQPCRLPYKLRNNTTGDEKSGFLMSPKDICNLDNLKDLVESGTASLKIEGRMKKPEYVAGVVESYKKALNSIYDSQVKIDYEAENKKLLKLFNREGFSKAYMYGNAGKDMMAYSYPKNIGILLGKVLKDLTVVINDNLFINDGIRNGEEGFTISKMIKSGVEVKEAIAGDRVRIYPANYKNGDVLYKTLDTKLNEELGKSYSRQYIKRIPLNIQVDFTINKPIVLKAIYNDRNYEVKGEIVQEAVNRPMLRERLEENLIKTGDSPFKIQDIEYWNFDKGFLTVSSINSVRRELIDKIMKVEKESRRKSYSCDELKDFQKILKENLNAKAVKHSNEKSHAEYLICINSKEQLKAVEEMNMESIAIDIFKRGRGIDIQNINCRDVYIKVPNIIKKEFEQICTYIENILPNIKGILTGNLGIINKFYGKTKIIGDYKLNIFNNSAVRFMEKYVDTLGLSVELNKKELMEFMKVYNSGHNGASSIQMLLYGKVELMVSEYCPIGSVMGGCDLEHKCSGICDKGQYSLIDRKGEEFVIRNDRFCRSHIYNSVPNNLIPNVTELEDMNIHNFRLDFVDEGYEETLNVLKGLLDKQTDFSPNSYTKGHYKRGVE